MKNCVVLTYYCNFQHRAIDRKTREYRLSQKAQEVFQKHTGGCDADLFVFLVGLERRDNADIIRRALLIDPHDHREAVRLRRLMRRPLTTSRHKSELPLMNEYLNCDTFISYRVEDLFTSVLNGNYTTLYA